MRKYFRYLIFRVIYYGKFVYDVVFDKLKYPYI